MITSAQQTWPEFFDINSSITLNNNERLIRRYGKYEPGLAFILSDKNVDTGWYDMSYHHIELNIQFDSNKNEIYWMPGDYWISKKGTTCFRPNENGKHVLVKARWGGPFQSSRGTEYQEVKNKALYARRASSNGGGVGYNYYIFDKDFTNEVSIEDI